MPHSEETFEDLYSLRKDIGSLIRNLCKCSGAQPVITYTSQRMITSFEKLPQTKGDSYIGVLAEIEACIFVFTELGKTLSSE